MLMVVMSEGRGFSVIVIFFTLGFAVFSSCLQRACIACKTREETINVIKKMKESV